MNDIGYIVVGIGLVMGLASLLYFVITSSAPWAIMTKKWLLEKKAWLTTGAVFAALSMFYLSTRKRDVEQRMDKRNDELKEKLAEARIGAALEIGKAQGKEDQVQAEVAQISNMEDKDKQLEELASLVTRVRRKR